MYIYIYIKQTFSLKFSSLLMLYVVMLSYELCEPPSVAKVKIGLYIKVLEIEVAGQKRTQRSICPALLMPFRKQNVMC